MKKFLLILAAIVLAIIAISSVGHMFGMAISLVIVYFSLKQFMETKSTGVKIIWAIIGLFGLSGLMASLPALAGVVAVYILYTGYKNWDKKSKETMGSKDYDPFSNFDKEWEKLKKSN